MSHNKKLFNSLKKGLLKLFMFLVKLLILCFYLASSVIEVVLKNLNSYIKRYL